LGCSRENWPLRTNGSTRPSRISPNSIGLSRQQKEELERSNQWADTLNRELEERCARIVELQEEFAREQESARKVAEGYAARFREQEEERERSNQWAEALNRELEERRARIVEMQEEFAREQENARQVAEGYAAKVAALELDIRDKTRWALDTETRLTAVIRDQAERLSVAVADLSTAVEALHHTEKELEERTAWALRLQDEARRLGRAGRLVPRFPLGEAGPHGPV